MGTTTTRRQRRWPRWALRAALGATIAALLAITGSQLWLRSAARGWLYDDPAAVPATPVALVLGAQVNPSGEPSAFLAARLGLAKRLYDTGKVRALLVSGDHGRWTYDEPGVMRTWLVAHAVPAPKVVADYAGFDTYDSCQRARRVFGVQQVIVVTQAFHLARAVAVCRAAGLDAIGIGDTTVREAFPLLWRRGVVREYGAGVKAAWDVGTRRDPVFLGPRETGVDDALRG